MEAKENEVEFRRFTLLDLVNINTNPLPMTLTKEFSWGFKADYGPYSNTCTDCSNFGIEGVIGSATRLNSYVMFYGLVGGRLHTPTNYQEDFFSQISELGNVINVSKDVTTHFSVNYSYEPFEQNNQFLLKGETSYKFKHNYDFRTSLEHDGDGTAFLLSIGYYFD